MKLKKYCLIILMSAFTTTAYSQVDVTANASIDEVITSSSISTLIRANGDLFCIATNDDADATIDTALSNRLYAAALTAQASGTTVDIRSSRTVNGCNGNFPQVVDLRINSIAN